MRPFLPVLINSSGVAAAGAFGLLRAIEISTASDTKQFSLRGKRRENCFVAPAFAMRPNYRAGQTGW